MSGRKAVLVFFAMALALNGCNNEDERSEAAFGNESRSSESGTPRSAATNVSVVFAQPGRLAATESSSKLSAAEAQVDELNALAQEGGEHDALAELLAALHSDYPEVRLTAVLGLKRFAGNPELILPLLSVLDDPESDIVIEAIEILAEANDERAIAKLDELGVRHVDEMVRELAADAADQLAASQRQ